MPVRTRHFAFALITFTTLAPIAATAAPKLNAADEYRRLFKIAEALPEHLDDVLDYTYSDPLPDQLTADHIAIVKFSDPIFKMLAKADAIEYCDFEFDDSDPLQAKWVGLGSAPRTIAKMAALRARYHLREGNPRQAITDLMLANNLGRRFGRTNILIFALVGISIDALVYEHLAYFAPLLSQEDRAFLRQALKGRPAMVTFRALVHHERTKVVNWLKGEYLNKIDEHTKVVVDGFKFLHQLMSGILKEEPDPYDPKHMHLAAFVAKHWPSVHLRLVEEFDLMFLRAEQYTELPLKECSAKWQAMILEQGKDNPLLQGLGIYILTPYMAVKTTLFRIQTSEAMIHAGLDYLDGGEATLKRHRQPETNKPFKFEKTNTGFKLTDPKVDEDDREPSLHFGWPEPEPDDDCS